MPGVLDLDVKVEGRILRNIRSNCLRSGGRLAMRIPTESSVALQIVRSTPSQVGSRVLSRALSSIVLKMEHMVALIEISLEDSRRKDYLH